MQHLLQLHVLIFSFRTHTEEDNVKNFLSGLEDCSASKSDKNDSVFVFLANYATELWYGHYGDALLCFSMQL